MHTLCRYADSTEGSWGWGEQESACSGEGFLRKERVLKAKTAKRQRELMGVERFLKSGGQSFT